MNVSDICTREVVTCGREASGVRLAQLMRDHHVGDVVVVERREEGVVPVGIVTDRDMVVTLLAKNVAPDAVTAGDLMGDALATVLGSEAIHDAVWHMRGRGVRRLPVVDRQGRLAGVLSADDLTAFLAAELTQVAGIAPCQARLERRALDATAG
ncbi:MAG TPA: CBS domain-containing protein [Albitalea sp.]